MPLTFAHPAIVLPFSRKSKYVHFSALVLGSMAPDYEYFLRGQPLGEIGHTFSGFLILNLPMVVLIYCIYHVLIHQMLVSYLPNVIQDHSTRQVDSSRTLRVIVFGYSAILGMLTHVVWDAFTHQKGFMVTRIPALGHTFQIAGYDIPVYKLLQHGSTLVGLSVIVAYMIYRASYQKGSKVMDISPKQKLVFWFVLFSLTLWILGIWYLIDDVSIRNYGIAVVRIIDSSLISLLILSLVIKYTALFPK
ncbi:DUF4184 family protein [Paenibacillus sp. EC2-1]|uniref:DUF4184 family protein n=1 Tax=Paenibacillus sp. EC2-1 TaxID=3388665 RepID=UPI003BEF12D8